VRSTEQVSFDDRELLIVDERHRLKNRTASLFVGFSIAPGSVTAAVNVFAVEILRNLGDLLAFQRNGAAAPFAQFCDDLGLDIDILLY